MKKIFRTLAIVAVAALGLTACENDINEQIKENEGEKVTVEVVASTPAGTRSAFGDKVDGAYTSTWSKDQVVYFAPYQPTEGNIAMSEATVEATGAEATFSVDFAQTQEEGAIYAFSPKGAQNGAGGFTSSSIYYSEYMYLNVPAAQTTSATSCDEQVHVLYASKEYTGGFPTSVNMEFNHVLAYGKMTIKGFEGEIESVAITFPENVAGGSVQYYYLTNTFTGASANTITVTNDIFGNKDIWFGIVPTESGEEKMSGDMTVVVTDSEGKTYTKPLATTGKLAFIQGQVSAFAVNMAGVEADKVVVYNGLTADEISAGLDKAGLGGYGQVTFDSSCGDWVGYVYGANQDKVLQMNSSKEAFYLESPVFDQYVESVEITFTGDTTVDRSIYAVAVDANRGYSIDNAYGSVTTAEKKEQTLTLTFNASTKQFALLAQGGAVYISNIAVNLTDVAIIPTLPTPVVGATAKGNAITLTWGTVANAASYNVTYGDTTTNTTDTTMTIEGLEYNTEYTFEVVAVSANAEQYKNSVTATISATTEVDMGNLAEGYFYKVTSAPVDFSGTYLIVYEDGSVAFDGSLDAIDAAGNSVAVTIENNAIKATAELGESIFTIAKVDGGYTIQSASGYYLGRTNTGNGMDESKTIAHKNTIEISNGVAVIKTVSYAPSLQYYNSGANSRFRYYATSQQAIQLYKLNGEIPEPLPALATPTVTAIASGNTIAVSWNAIDSAASYTVTCGTTEQIVSVTDYTFEGLDYGKTYDITVVANPADNTKNNASAAGTAQATTEPDPNAPEPGATKTVTFTFGDMDLTNSTAYPSFESAPITISATKGTVEAAYYFNDKTWRVYKGGTLTVATSVGKITSIEATGTLYFDGLTDGAWTGEATSVALPCTTNSRIKTLVITYTE